MIWLVIAGMFAVTYVPRVLPFLLGREIPFPRWLRRWLRLFPYAALGALILPGILNADPGRSWVGLSAGAVAAGVSLLTRSLMLTVLAAILYVFLLKALLP